MDASLMISGIRLKICGLRSLVDAEAADVVGADFLGFNFYPASPRYVSLPQFRAMVSRLPERKKVAVVVQPSLEELGALRDGGIDAFQIHFPLDVREETLAAWRDAVEKKRLWLAPKLPPGEGFPVTLLDYADTFLIDTYAKDSFGGTGRTGDWEGFRNLSREYPEKTWILAGGLTPENVAAALRESGARVIDLSSGVEVAPGVKDPAKLRQLAIAIRSARDSSSPR